MPTVKHLILGSGISGISASYHLGHEECTLLEKKSHAFGHLASSCINGFTWDEGPHVSFTSSPYVRQLFEESVAGKCEDYPVAVGNWFHGNWIDHPAQSNLYQAPAEIRERVLESFLASRGDADPSSALTNYGEWIEQAFGREFSDFFPRPYTRKYWTLDPEKMGVDWVGGRVFRPSIEDVVRGAIGPLERKTHYIKTVRYPEHGGFQSFVEGMARGANFEFGREVTSIDLVARIVVTADGCEWKYETLVNTLPLPVFVGLCVQSTLEMKQAAGELDCSKLLLVNVTAPHSTRRPEHWLYVYDEDMLSTRINFTESLSPNNAPAGHTGIQVEVYFSRHRPLPATADEIRSRVIGELLTMKLLDTDTVGDADAVVKRVDWANVIFTLETPGLLDVIWNGLEPQGLVREPDDLHPLTNWGELEAWNPGPLVMAGRFGQWKYFWSDDCVLRGKHLGGGRKA